jgi:hypothetical protein
VIGVNEAITILIEANAPLRKRRALAKPEHALEREIANAFAAEGSAFVTRLARVWTKPAREVREAGDIIAWQPLWDEIAEDTAPKFTRPLDRAYPAALQAGMGAAIADLGIEPSFTLKHPAAVDYLRDRGANQIKRIHGTTRETLRTILSQAAEEGWSYNRTAKAIKERYRHFSKERAKRIAVYELGDAYEHGNMLVGIDLQEGGLEMQKQWLTVGDHRVRADHKANQKQGWIPLDDAFQDGTGRPPADPGCRCTLLMRRKPDDE